MADLARQELTALLMDIESAWHSEGRRMASRADWLRNESDDHFAKMSPGALQRLNSEGQSSREQSQDDDTLDNLSSVLARRVCLES